MKKPRIPARLQVTPVTHDVICEVLRVDEALAEIKIMMGGKSLVHPVIASEATKLARWFGQLSRRLEADEKALAKRDGRAG